MVEPRDARRHRAPRRERRAAALLVLGALTLGPASCGEPSPPPPNVVLITIDTLRADALGCYGYPLDTSPSIDALAASGVLFSDCSVQWPKTWPSMASLVTGAYPRTTGMRLAHKRMPAEFPLLSELFVAAGFQAAAVVANWNVGRTRGFDRGFEHFVESWLSRWRAERGNVAYRNASGRVKEYTDAALVTDQGLAWLDGIDGEKPFYLWLHYMDPHGPYVPPASHADLFAGEHRERPIALEDVPEYQRQAQAPGGAPSTDAGFYRAQYDREVRYLDDQLGRLFDELRARGLADTTLIALTADHGETFGEHDTYFEHGKLSYQDTVHVPLILSWPGTLPAGRVVDTPVGVLDLSATLVDLAGLDPVPTHEGTSLGALARGDSAGPKWVFSEAGYHEGKTQRVVRNERWKLIEVRAEADQALMRGVPYELYDLSVDPTEQMNVADDNPDIVVRMAAALEAWSSSREVGDGGEEIDISSLPDEAREMLEALGYLDETGADQH